MSGRLRLSIALLFVAMFWLLPAPDSGAGRAALATLQVRRWLLQPDGPLQGFARQGRLPALGVDLRLSPPDEARHARHTAELARTAAEWAAARTAEARSSADHVVVDPTLPPLPLQVHVGESGTVARFLLTELTAPGRPPDPATDAGLLARLASAGLRADFVLAAAAEGTAQAIVGRPSGPHQERLLATLTTTGIALQPFELAAGFPGRDSLLPAFLAIVVAVLLGRVLPALLLGCLAGAYAIVRGAGAGWLEAAPGAALHLFGVTLWEDVLGGLRVWESGSGFQVRIILFVVFLFMAIGVMARCGGILGLVQVIARFARGPVRTQLCAYVTGLLIFFDDYTNCIVAGTTMQPVTDRNRVSREKLAYIVDSTAAPVAGLSLFSTWIAYEVSQYQASLCLVTRADGSPYVAADAFTVFAETLPFRFYCIFTLLLVPLTILLGREFGPMLTAERRARLQGKPVADGARPMVARSMADLQPPDGVVPRARNGLLPVLTLLGTALGLIWYYGAYGDDGYRVPASVTGFLPTAQWILGHTASEKALLWASLATFVVAAGLALGQRILTLRQVLHAAARSAQALVLAIGILLLAWCIGRICDELGTSYFLTAGFRGWMRAEWLPALVFCLAGLMAFATGTSFGTMAILLPNTVVLAHGIGSESAIGGPALMVLTIGAVLEGSIFGDHCSPISDTTVLSSLGTRCDHLAHVQTQMPYALLAMLTALGCGYLPMVWLGPGWWPLAMLAGVSVMAAFLRLRGGRPDRPA